MPDTAANVCTTSFLIPNVPIIDVAEIDIFPSGMKANTAQWQDVYINTTNGKEHHFRFLFYYYPDIVNTTVIPMHALREYGWGAHYPINIDDNAYLFNDNNEIIHIHQHHGISYLKHVTTGNEADTQAVIQASRDRLRKQSQQIVANELTGKVAAGYDKNEREITEMEADSVETDMGGHTEEAVGSDSESETAESSDNDSENEATDDDLTDDDLTDDENDTQTTEATQREPKQPNRKMTFMQAHAHFGHARNKHLVKKACTDHHITLTDNTWTQCISCDGNNLKQRTRRGPNAHHIDKSIGAWSLDFKPDIISGNEGYNNKMKHGLVLVNNHTHYIHATTSETKGAGAIKDWIIDFVRTFHVTSLRGDEEFAPLEHLPEMVNVECEFTGGYAPQSNGIAERYVDVLFIRMNTLLHAGNLTYRLWDDAWLHAAAVWNIMPHRDLKGKTPASFHEKGERKYGCPSEYLLPFGTLVWKYTAPPRREKYDTTKAELGLYIGGDKSGYHFFTKSHRPQVERSIKVIEMTPQAFADKHPGDFEDIEFYFDFNMKYKSSRARHASGGDASDSDEDTTSSTTTRSPVNDDELQQSLLLTTMQEAGSALLSTPNPWQRITRNKRGRRTLLLTSRQPQAKGQKATAIQSDTLIPGVMVSFAVSQRKKDKDQSLAAMKKEMHGLIDAKVFQIVPAKYVKGRKTVKLLAKSILKHNGKYKGRAVLDGRDINLDEDVRRLERYTPTAGLEMVKLIVALAKREGMKLAGVDVTQAYIQRAMAEGIIVPVQMDPHLPAEFQVPEGMAAILNAPLYGLPCSGNLWYEFLRMILEALGFQVLATNPGVFVREGKNEKGKMYIATYVDDLLIAYEHQEDYTELLTQLRKKFPMTEQVGNKLQFLGVDIHTSEKGTTLSQVEMADRLITRMQLTEAKAKPAPLPQDATKCTSKSGEALNEDFRTQYRSAVGMLGYLTYTRPDLLYARHFLSRYVQAPTTEHWRMLMHCARYVVGTRNLGLVFKGDRQREHAQEGRSLMQVFVDSDHATDTEDRKSVTGRAVFLNGDYISGESTKQKTPEGSSTGAEIRASANATRTAIGDQITLQMLGRPAVLPTPVMIDNQAAIDIYHSPKLGRKVKYLALDILSCRAYQKQGLVAYEKIDTKENIADMMTKALPGTTIKKLRDKFMVDTQAYH